MATQRLINTNFWRDTYVDGLNPSEKLLFLYLLTNPHTTLIGIYEISLRVMAMDTGFDKDMLEKMLARLSLDNKVHYKKGWIILPNFIKHQRLNPSIIKGIERAYAELPDWVQSDTDSPQLNLTKLNLKKLKETEAKETKSKHINIDEAFPKGRK